MSSLRRDTSYNLVGNLTPAICAALFIPFLHHSMGDARFGLMTIMWALIGYFGVFDLGVSRALTYHAAQAATKPEELLLAPRVRAGMQIAGSASAVGLVALGGGAEAIARILLKGQLNLLPEAKTALLITACSIPLTTLGNGLRGALEGLSRFREAAWIKAVSGSIFFVAPAALCAAGLTSLVAVSGAFFVARLITLIWCWQALRSEPLYQKSIGARTSSADRRVLMSYGAWALLTSILSPLMVYGDRAIISAMLGVATVGIYSILQETLGRTLIASASFTAAVLPRFVQMPPSERRKAYNRYLSILFIGMLAFYGATAILAPPALSWWLNKNMEEHRTLLFLFSLALFINSLAQLPYAFLLAAGRPDLPAKLHTLEFVLYIPACIVATYLFGLTGAAGVWVGRVAIDLILLQWAAKRILHS